MEKVVIIVPTYNEFLVIKDTLTQLIAVTTKICDYDVHILVFDSMSTDGTQEVVKKLQRDAANLHLQCEPFKSGLGSAYLQAMQYALSFLEADIVFEFDADLSHQPKYIQPMLEKIKICDVVVGSRYVKHGSVPKNWALYRKLLSAIGNYIARIILTPKYKDFTSGLRATRSQYLAIILNEKFLSNGYAYKLQLLWLLHIKSARICEYPIEFLDREQGDSKLPKNSILDSLKVIFCLRFQRMAAIIRSIQP
ncbi:MAG: hypothetical protein A3E88_06135 [Legionellales bacterium RIFCSPHIGHO2_12_FULL_35_11]|nr:MAG: hypothetical protein A3E88_06135 [Legionellales bacterium RIFCSPHIGHO2_12_FULL_35_11]